MQCQSKTVTGEVCQADAGPSCFCYFHDPANAEKAKAARLEGGLHRQTPKSSEYPGAIKGMNDVVTWVNASLQDTWRQENSDRRSKSLSSLLRIAIEALEGSEIDKRLTQLEELIYANSKKNS